MKINRNNYEEYFLLYADNELDAITKVAVENFINENTDLGVELNMLMQTKSLPEQIFFTDKENLLRTEGNSINETNYEEYFLLYIDNELSAAKREEVEMYVLQHPKLQDEFTTLKQAVLKPETISYTDKKDLYRTEKRRTIYLKPWRLAAAAVLIGVCAIGVWMWQKPSVITAAHVHSTQFKVKQQPTATKPVDTINHQPEQIEQTVAQQQALPSVQNKTAEEKSVIKKKHSVIKDKQVDIAQHEASTQEEIKPPNVIEHNNIAKQNIQPVENNDVAIEQLPSNKKELITAQQQPETNNEINNGYKLYNVAYKEINTNDDDNSLHVGGLDLNKNKVKNLFRKAKDLFKNKQDRDANDGKLQVANFEINTIKQ